MNFTNNKNLPEWVHRGLTYSTYNRDNIRFDISATKLIDSPQIAELWREHGKDVVEDSMDRVWSAWGTATHSVFEEANKAAADVLMEKRFLSTYKGKVVSAQIDTYEIPTKILSDIKTTGAFKIIKGDYSQWENQTNVGAQLMRDNGYEVEKIQIVALVKDWSAYKAKNERNYPENPVVTIDIPLWEPEVAKKYIEERVYTHFSVAEKECSDAERWVRPGRFAVHKKGRKSALRLVDSEEQAKSYIKWAKIESDDKVYIEERKAQYIRCEGYCAFGKLGVCPQLNKENNEDG